ncbi:hypothetical protein ACHAWF_004873 [Thalassiosira exigua]
MDLTKTTLPILTMAATRAMAEGAFNPTGLDSIMSGVSGDALPAIGTNVNGGAVFQNYFNMINDGQFFLLKEVVTKLEKPSSEAVKGSALQWCGNIEFSEHEPAVDDPVIGYTANCVLSLLEDFRDNLVTAGSQNPSPLAVSPNEFKATMTLSAVYVPQSNVFEGQLHKSDDNLVIRYWDDGRLTASTMGWEVHDEGDIHPNADTSSWSQLGGLSWISAGEAASLLNNNATDLTPEAFRDIYREVWMAYPPHAAALDAENENVDTENATGTKNEGAGSSSTASATELESEGIGFDETTIDGFPGMGDALPAIGTNVGGGSVFQNYFNTRNNGQLFLLREFNTQFEKPSSAVVKSSFLYWCSNMEFSEIDPADHPVVGYSASCLMSSPLGHGWSIFDGAGGQHTSPLHGFADTTSLSAVYIPQTNVFEGTLHKNTDNYVTRFFDDGLSTMPHVSWEVHDEGDVHPKAPTSSWSGFGKISWLSADEAANLFNQSSAEFTPELFESVYREVWTANPPQAASLEAVKDSEDENTTDTMDTNSIEEENDGSNTTSSGMPSDDGMKDDTAVENALGVFNSAVISGLPFMGKDLPAIGYNIDGGSVFQNYFNMRNNGQLFLMWEYTIQFEKPSSSVVGTRTLYWCSNIEISEIDPSDHPVVGYVASCVRSSPGPGGGWSVFDGAGGQHSSPIISDFVDTMSLSAVYVPQTNVFEGTLHKNSDNYVIRFFDDGLSTVPHVSWEVHDEGDGHPNAATSSWSGFGHMSWLSAEEAAGLLNKSSADFTLESFEDIYMQVWKVDPPHAAVLQAKKGSEAENTNQR